jgi:hypothetical protein
MLLLLLACTGTNGSDSVGGCATSGDLSPTCPCDDPSVEIGTGTKAFQAVSEGGEATMVHGPQGGWHVLAAAQFENLAPIVSIHYTITVVSSGTVVSDNSYRVQMVADGDCTGYFPNMYGYLDVTELADGDLDTPPETLAGQDLLLSMEVEDTDDRTATDTLTVVAALDPVDEEP